MKLLHRLALAALAVMLVVSMTACAAEEEPAEPDTDEPLGSVSVIGVWGGGEVEAFESVVAGWEEETGGSMEFESTRDLSAILTARVAGGNPPDIAILPNPALLAQFAEDLVSLDGILDSGQLGNDYTETWIDQGSVDGTLYGLYVKAATKSTVWYNPAQFDENGYETPESWDELVALTDQIRGEGKTPWSIGIESGGASGWPASDWIQEIILAESGPDVYDQWVDHEIPWTDDAIKSAFEKFGEIALTDGNVAGGAEAILATNFEPASYLPFEDPPRAYMYFLGAFAQGFIADQFPDLEPVTDYDFFGFPYVDAQFAGAATGGADVAVMFNDTPEARSLMNYFAQADSWIPWAEAGGFSSPNRSLDTSVYPDELAAKAAEQLTESEIFRFDGDDLMPAEVQSAFWTGIMDYLQRPGEIDTILADIERVAAEAYQ